MARICVDDGFGGFGIYIWGKRERYIIRVIIYLLNIGNYLHFYCNYCSFFKIWRELLKFFFVFVLFGGGVVEIHFSISDKR